MTTRPEEDAQGAPTTFRGLTLFPFQREAIAAIFSGRSVVVAAPTGAGKTLVADYAIDRAITARRRVIYTSPIKALSNQKYRDFREQFGDSAVGIMTGDVTIRPDAELLVMTTEIFRNTLFEAPERLDGFDFVIFDEVHYLDDRERGTVWEEALIYAPSHIRIVALSATVPNVREFSAWIAEVRGTPVDTIVEETRPVPLVHKVWIPGRGPRSLPEVREHYLEMGRFDTRDRQRSRRHKGRRPPRRVREEVLSKASDKLLDHMQQRKMLPAIYFCFSRRDVERLAKRNAQRSLLTPAEQRRMLDHFDDLASRYEVTDAYDTVQLRTLAAQGVLHHHAGMLPIDKEIVERLFTTGLVKLLFATETFALGVNMPARSVVFHSLLKYDGVRYGRILAREYWQMAGRAGRQGIDDRGWVYSLLDMDRITYPDLERLHSGRTEPVRSRFNLSYSGITNLYARVGEKVTDAWSRSFARFQRESGQHGRRGKNGTRVIRARLRVLEAFDYIADEALTRKGLLCGRINGYEVQVCEAYEGGWLHRLDPVTMAMLFAAIVYEPRPYDESDPPRRKLKGVRGAFEAHMQAFAAEELAGAIPVPTKGPEYGIVGIVERWAEGADFDRLVGHTSLAPGDLVRLLRMTNQLLRQTAHALPAGDPVIGVLLEARRRIDRDVVDARRQLELG